MKVEVDIPGSPDGFGLTVSVDVKHHERKRRVIIVSVDTVSVTLFPYLYNC